MKDRVRWVLNGLIVLGTTLGVVLISTLSLTFFSIGSFSLQASILEIVVGILLGSKLIKKK